ncbi:TolB family protein [Paenibacillus sp. IHBB 10380]|uniref:TolB family protein n=1 Tax=Paenibacillus sp. IHBB 10380 TaxID=1566358 RepID=UPI0005CFEB29|nr:PD40 domain-containing protein [Paenibacillus sp. IHBB 10380]AJS57288.1 hypothetical protein UB51_00860 [Paenibacillus sp. IHBB 10380]
MRLFTPHIHAIRISILSTLLFIGASTVIPLQQTVAAEDLKSPLTGAYDVSASQIVYVTSTSEINTLNLYDPKQNQQETLVNSNERLLDPDFSPDGSSLAFIEANAYGSSEPRSSIKIVNLRTGVTTVLLEKDSNITEIEWAPDGDSVFFLQAGSFKNYSPIASKRAHDFDVYEQNLTKEEPIRHTYLEKYELDSLQISKDGQYIYVAMMDDAHAKTADDIFNAKQKIFQFPLNDTKSEGTVISPTRERDIYDFTWNEKSDLLYYQSVAKTDDKGTFEYELYSYEPSTTKEKQLTSLGEFTNHPVSIGNTLYFMVDKAFATSTSDYSLYMIDSPNSEPKQIELPIQVPAVKDSVNSKNNRSALEVFFKMLF